ncbi:MAG TPA: L-seryl-tRNA(Sec) selenium transferase [Acidimicrobiales bacterium]|nr:L-seryl-tRNA(Sec) selenium transferase [Acidimicrobiales bacterium]
MAPPRPPSVDALARQLVDVGLPHPLLVDAARAAIAAGDPSSARARAEAVAAALLRPVINATGVILHTNLGRAPLGDRGAEAAGSASPRYSNLEFDLVGGRRGSRSDHAAGLLARLVGAEAALVVNNGASALLLILAALARDRPVVVSRGELVEIGGGFRVPEVMAQSGAALVEVGTTNRTRLSDYRAAVDEFDPALLLKVHQSNYRMVGFTEDVGVAALATLGPPVVADIGSGLLDAATPWLAGGPPAWLAGEPAALQTLAAGAGLVSFSGDKLMGGPQAGIIAGRRDLVAACARHPLNRALRPGGLVLAALQETALAYLRRDGDAIPFWRMAAAPVEELRGRARAMRVGTVIDTVAVAGGGSVPGQEVPSAGVAIEGDHAAWLRANDPPIVARVHEGRTICDFRTVDEADTIVLFDALGALAGSLGQARREPSSL